MAISKAIIAILLVCACGGTPVATVQAQSPPLTAAGSSSATAQAGRSAVAHGDVFRGRDIGALLALTLLLTAAGRGRRRDRAEVLAS